MGGKVDWLDDILRLAAEIAGREKYVPEKSVKAYKLFRQKNDKLYPLFVDAKEEVPVDAWLRAQAGTLTPDGKVKSAIGPLAYRPGWHSGDLPIATHIGGKSDPSLTAPDYRPSGQVWAEVDMADDVPWQAVAEARARMTKKGIIDPKTAHITDQVPVGGHYRYKTNPNMTGQWLIGGDMKVNRVLSDDEVREINNSAGVSDLPRREGYGPGGIIDDAVRMAGKIVAGEGDDAAKAALRSAADEVPAHLRPGFRVEAAPNADEETRNLVDYLSRRDPSLSFDPQSLAERREDLGTTVDAFHGSPRNIHRFSNRYSTPEGYWGAHHYFTTSPVDASMNYATPNGPDITNRLEREAESVLDNFHPDDVSQWHEGKYGTAEGIDPTNSKLVKEYSDDIARSSLGITNEGAVYPVNLRMKNPVRIDSPNQTFWNYDVEYDDAGDIVSEGGKAVDLINTTRDVLSDYNLHKDEIDDIIGRLDESMLDNGGIDAKTYNDVVRGKHIDAYDADGNLVGGGQIMSDVFQRMGHDSVDMPTDVFAAGFGRTGMPGTGGDTRHYIIFDPTNIRSRFGAFDPFKSASDRISDADGGAVEDEEIGDALRIAKGGGGAFTRLVTDLLGPAERKGLQELTRPGSGYKGIAGKPDVVKIPFIGEAEAKPMTAIEDAAANYMRRVGREGQHQIEAFPPLDEKFAAQVADEYGRMRHDPSDPDVKRAYDALAQETLDQLAAAKDAGIDVSFVRGEDPYKASPSLGYADLAERGHLWVFPTELGFGSDVTFDPRHNPLTKRIGKLGDLEDATVNDAFRIVHDLFGHYGPGNPFFRAPGEERAFKLHSKMYSPEALPAMASETRGQNSWLNFGPYGRHNRSANAQETIYADQKTGIMPPWTYEKADGGAVDNALRIAKDVGGSTPVLMEDAKGNKYDAQGRIIPPTNPGPNPARSDMTPEEMGRKAAEDPATFDALMERYAIPDRDIMDYEATKKAVAQQPYETQQMTHVGAPPMRDVTVDAPLLGGELSLGSAPYNVAGPMAGAAQTVYDFKTAPLYYFPATAPIGASLDVAEGVANNDPTQTALAALGAPGKYAKAATIGAASYLVDPAEAQAGPERWFSKALEVAKALPMEKMGGEQALAMLRKAVSPEELRWTGTDRFLSGQKQVTKQDLVDYLAKNRVQTQDVVLGEKPTNAYDIVPSDALKAKYQPQLDAVQEKLRKLKEDFYAGGDSLPFDDPNYMSQYTYRQAREELLNEGSALEDQMRYEAIAEIGGLGVPTKYSNWSTPGGQNYGETLITMPNLPGDEITGYQVHGLMPRKFATKEEADKYIENLGLMLTDPNFEAMHNDLRRFPPSIEPIYNDGGFQSGHWRENPNVLAHVRHQMLEATPPGANRPYKAWNTDELQSDWGQAGRKEGFRNPALDRQVEEVKAQRYAIEQQIKDIQKGMDDEFTQSVKPLRDANEREEKQLLEDYRAGKISIREYNDGTRASILRYQDASKEYNDKRRQIAIDVLNPLREQRDRLVNQSLELKKKTGSVAAAPYVQSTEGWTDLSIKKALDKALDSDAEYFTWTPGNVHADRYSLDKHIKKLAYDPRYGTLEYHDGDEWHTAAAHIDEDQIENYVGKEVAQNLIRRQRNEYGRHVLEGLDLRTGGEGMRKYYDSMVPKRLTEIIRKATGKKPEIETITVDTSEGPRQQLGIRLTDEMREQARFSDFNKGGRVSDDTVNKALSLTADM